jgi:hypothetical protein
LHDVAALHLLTLREAATKIFGFAMLNSTSCKLYASAAATAGCDGPDRCRPFLEMLPIDVLSRTLCDLSAAPTQLWKFDKYHYTLEASC